MVNLNVEAGILGLVFNRNCVSNSNRYSKRQPFLNTVISAYVCYTAYYFNVDYRCLFYFNILYGYNTLHSREPSAVFSWNSE